VAASLGGGSPPFPVPAPCFLTFSAKSESFRQLRFSLSPPSPGYDSPCKPFMNSWIPNAEPPAVHLIVFLTQLKYFSSVVVFSSISIAPLNAHPFFYGSGFCLSSAFRNSMAIDFRTSCSLWCSADGFWRPALALLSQRSIGQLRPSSRKVIVPPCLGLHRRHPSTTRECFSDFFCSVAFCGAFLSNDPCRASLGGSFPPLKPPSFCSMFNSRASPSWAFSRHFRSHLGDTILCNGNLTPRCPFSVEIRLHVLLFVSPAVDGTCWVFSSLFFSRHVPSVMKTLIAASPPLPFFWVPHGFDIEAPFALPQLFF